ncbi:acetyltransferase [Chitinophaga nivalis]|uniref:Acetyltransferase n=1 Tax=Chitinophaga nivalis TaxID=2991709 RepID=A0ABT3IEI0_9BACT|nr:acetyltransferase [Chitinophaga nivalis]MCW3467952.1 acetyltransferase [Chitinophaga nivalis]MCW3482357.1 acetyltransferase [Chitinophaga nivalis]
MQEIYILGAGGFAKEVYFLITQIGGYDIRGFVDIKAGDPIKIGKTMVPVWGEADIADKKGAALAIGIGQPKIIKKLAAAFGEGFYFPNLIHPGVIIDEDNVTFGRGNILTANVVFTTGITVGSFNIFNLATTVGHDVVIGDHNVFNPCVAISGFVKIGDTNLIGVKATILEGKTVGSQSIVGAAGLVLKDVPDNVTVVGVPAVIK